MTRSERDLAARLRREPPRFRAADVSHVEPLTPRMMRVTLAGPELQGLTIEDPAASVRGLLPSPGASGLVIPTWNGNEFLLPDGSRPIIRTFTPYRVDPEFTLLHLDPEHDDAGDHQGRREDPPACGGA